MQKYGFVYLWFDRKHKRFYVGCHWGKAEDSYICSSNWMRDSYKRRSNDFKRRILSTNLQSLKEMFDEEHRYLMMIKKEELGKRYYNLNNKHKNHWSTSEESKKTVGQKISEAPNRAANISKALTGKKVSEETKEKLRQINTGKKHKPETIEKIKQNHNRDYSDPIFKAKMTKAARSRSKETRQKIAENSRRLVAEGKVGMKGRKHSEETKKKMRESYLKRISHAT